MFIIEVVLCSVVELDHVILGGVSDVPFTNMKGEEYSFQYNAVQFNTTTAASVINT